MVFPRRVLHVIDSLDLGGAQTFLLDLVRNHDRSRYLPEVAVMHGRGVYAGALEESCLRIHFLSPGKFPPVYVPNFWRLMRKEKFDILHFHLFGANLCAKPLALAAGHPSIIVHDQCNDASRDRNPVLLTADALANRGVARVIAVSESVRRYLLDREDLDDGAVEMIPNGIDAEMFIPPTEVERAKARDDLGLPPEVLIVGGVGRLVSQKNFTVFLEVAARFLAHDPSAIFVIAGTGPQAMDLKLKASALGIGGSVRFLGHVSHRPGLYQALDALLLTSDFEGTPLTLLESMATGIPVIASAVDGIAEVCTDGHDAMLVMPRDVDGFASALDRVLNDRELKKLLGTNARATMVNRYEIRSITRRVERIYDKVLSERQDA